MQKNTKHLLKHKFIYIAIVITVAIAYLSLCHAQKYQVTGFTGIDKLEHSLAYFVLTLSWFLVIQHKEQLQKAKWIVVSLAFLYGFLMEFLQALITVDRQGDVFDVLANSSGILIALLLFKKITHFYQKRLG